MKNVNPWVILSLIILGAVLLGIWNFSRSIGADFQITFRAIALSMIFVVVIVAIGWFTQWAVSLIASLVAVALWPCWWSVMDSIAQGGVDPEKMTFHFPSPEVWWNGDIFKWGAEGVLVALVIYFAIRQYNDPYR